MVYEDDPQCPDHCAKYRDDQKGYALASLVLATLFSFAKVS